MTTKKRSVPPIKARIIPKPAKLTGIAHAWAEWRTGRGPQFREAFSCFVYSNEEPKGVDCVEKFKAMQDCFREHPDVYGEEIDDDEEDEPVEETGRPSNQDQPNSAKPESTPESNDRDEEHKDTPSGVPPPPSKAPPSRQNAPTANVSPENTATKRGKTD
ncbi:hypothetical protein RhiLY_07510 [Ceratobasidium sp. AG-Ba]|nr:hypothetical protein RhiLY_07510 [Ceratobasidium sp. AG-Ba]